MRCKPLDLELAVGLSLYHEFVPELIYDKLIFSPESKLATCLDNKIDIMVEDKPSNINEVSTKIPVIVVHSGYNENCHGNNIHMAYSWFDVYHNIKEFQC